MSGGSGLFKEILGWVIMPPDPKVSDFMEITDPELMSKAERSFKQLWFWRVKVSVLIAVLIVVMIIAWSPRGFVQAKDLGSRIDEVIKPLKDEQASINTKLAELAHAQRLTQASLDELVANGIANNICRYLGLMQVPNADKRSLRNDADGLQSRYRRLTGDFYPESRCGG